MIHIDWVEPIYVSRDILDTQPDMIYVTLVPRVDTFYFIDYIACSKFKSV